MVSREIEKEIDQENKVMLGCTVRQLICVGVTMLLSVVSCVVCKWDFDIALYPILCIACIACAFGWYKPNEEPFETFLWKKIRAVLYHSNFRKYRAKNQYITMMNTEYLRRRNIDLNNKKVAKEIKKNSKKKNKVKSQYVAMQ
jgi:hypothetical protein